MYRNRHGNVDRSCRRHHSTDSTSKSCDSIRLSDPNRFRRIRYRRREPAEVSSWLCCSAERERSLLSSSLFASPVATYRNSDSDYICPRFHHREANAIIPSACQHASFIHKIRVLSFTNCIVRFFQQRDKYNCTESNRLITRIMMNKDKLSKMSQ